MADVISLTIVKNKLGLDQVKKVIDVSEHNGRISDWKVIDDTGVDGVIVRLGLCGNWRDKGIG